MTVGEVISVANAIASLDTRPSGTVDSRGNPVMVPTEFHFPSSSRMVLALDVARGREVAKVYNEEVRQLRIKIAGAGKDVPQARMDEYVTAVEELESAPANVALGHIVLGDLCLDALLPRCPVKNDIPIGTLSALQPILDQ